MDKLERIKKEIKLKLSQYKKKYEELSRYEVWITAKEIEQRIKELKDVLFIIDTIEEEPVNTVWGADKKELKKIEQNSADKVEPKFRVKYAGSEYNVLEVKDIAGVTYYGIEDEPNHIDYVQAENCERVGGYSIKEKGSPYPTKPTVFSGQKPAWSEEDEDMLNSIIEDFGDGKTSNMLQEHWLKSLKERVGCEVNCTTTKEWSEEDEEHIMAIDLAVNRCLGKWHCCGEKCPISEHNPWLKSLKNRVQPQPKQEWSEEDEIALGDVLWCCKQAASIAKDENDMGSVWYAKRWLKSLKGKVQSQSLTITDEELVQSQSTWKPSGEQIKALNYVINIMASSESPKENDYYYNVFKDLREQLKKIKGLEI